MGSSTDSGNLRQKQTGTLPKEKTSASKAGEAGYFVSEIFNSIQGEGVQTGIPMTFVRFGGCNLRCSDSNAGFDCDTDFKSGRVMDEDELVGRIAHKSRHRWLCFTGGEPMLQLQASLISRLALKHNFRLHLETNGTIDSDILDSFDWIVCSPKSANHTIKIEKADEARYVRQSGQFLPRREDIPFMANYLVCSPACQPGGYREEDLEWCIERVEDRDNWRLSLQTHKIMRIR